MSNCCCDKIFHLNFKLKVLEEKWMGGSEGDGKQKFYFAR